MFLFSQGISTPSFLHRFLLFPFNVLLLRCCELEIQTQTESVRIRNSTQVTHLQLVPSSLPLTGLVPLKGDPPSPTPKGLSSSDDTFCLPSLDTNLIRGAGGDCDLFLCILKAQPGPIILRIFGKYVHSESECNKIR